MYFLYDNCANQGLFFKAPNIILNFILICMLFPVKSKDWTGKNDIFSSPHLQG